MIKYLIKNICSVNVLNKSELNKNNAIHIIQILSAF